MVRPKMKILILGLFALVTLLGCRRSEEKIGNKIIEQIECYRMETGRLPENLSEMGIKESEEGPYYQLKTDSTYILWYGTTLGESVIYDSERKEWK